MIKRVVALHREQMSAQLAVRCAQHCTTKAYERLFSMRHFPQNFVRSYGALYNIVFDNVVLPLALPVVRFRNDF